MGQSQDKLQPPGGPAKAGSISSPGGQSTEALKCAVPTTFFWTEPAQEVFVAGSYCGWHTKVYLPKQEDGSFKCVLHIPPGKHEYKFIVDGEWRCAPGQPQARDASGNLNNIVTVEEDKAQVPEVAAPETPVPELQAVDMTQKPPPSPRSSYDDYLPPPSDFGKEPRVVPAHLGFGLLNAPSRDPLILQVPPHVMLNHVYRCTTLPDGVYAVSSTKRFRNKFVTTLFYTCSPGTLGCSLASKDAVSAIPAAAGGPFKPKHR